MATLSADRPGTTLSFPLVPIDTEDLGVLLDLALEATAATGAAAFVASGDGLRVHATRGVNAPLADERLSLEGTVAGEAWYRGRLVMGAEPVARGRQAARWQDDRTIDVMGVPVLVEGRPVAVLVLYHRHLGHFRKSDATSLNRLAAIAAGLWRGPVTGPPQATSRADLEVRAAARMALVAAGHFEEPDAWGEVARTAATLLEVTSARVSLLEGDELICQAGAGRFGIDQGRRRPRTHGFEGVAVENPEGVLASDWTPDSTSGGSSFWIRSLVSVPLRRVQQVIGVLTVADEIPGRFTEADREALRRFAIHATAAMVEVRLTVEAGRHVSESRVETRIAAVLAGSEDTPALRRAIVSEIRQTLDADGARLSEDVQGHFAITAHDGELPASARTPELGTRLLCGHDFAPDEVSHRCTLRSGEGSLVAAKLGQVTDHPGCLQLVRLSRPFERHDEDLLRRLAVIAELALLSRLSNVRVSQYADRIRSVAEVSASLHQSLRPADAMRQAAEILRRALNVGTVRVGRVDEVLQELTFPVYRHGNTVLDGLRRPLTRGLLEEVWRTGRTHFFPQNAVEEVTAAGLTLDTSPRCVAVVPLRLRGSVAGVVAIEDEAHDHAFEAEDVRILEIVAQQLGVTLENLDGLEEERRQRITAEWLRQMARIATDPAGGPAQVFELAADAAFQGIGGLASAVGLLDEDGRVDAAWRGQPPYTLTEPEPIGGTVSGWIVEERGAVFVSANLAEDPRLSLEVRRRSGAIALAAAPVWCDNRAVAVLELFRDAGSSFGVAEVERLAQIADHAGAGYQTAKAGEALRKSEERYRRLFSTASDAIFSLDRQGMITSFNHAAELVWSVSVERAVGQRWAEVLSFEAPEIVADQIRGALAGEFCAVEAWFRRVDGERGAVAMSISPLVEDGRVTALLAISRDVTEARRVQAQLLQAEKMSAIGQLVGGMAHEINNPLASILVNMELLLEDAKDPAQLETLQSIKAEADRTAQIVRNLLTYVRGQGSERAIVDLREVVHGALALRHNQLLHQQIKSFVEVPSDPVPVWGNSVNLHQVLMNLLVNAEHAIRSSRGRGQVWVRLRLQEGHAVLTVEDDGPGIPPELLTRIFDPFYTTKPEGEGTGLGLSVTAGIVADHQGKIAALQRPGGGARFVVDLPIREPESIVGEPPAETSAPVPAPTVRHGKILLVDDEPDIRRSISKFLIRSGWEVDLADSGEEGLRRVGVGEYNVVLCDLRMPGMSGHEFYRRLERDASPAIERLVFMTGDVLSPEASRFLKEAGRPVLSKPFTLRDLTEVLAQVVPGS